MVTNYNEILYKNQVIESERLILRKFKEEDAADLLEWGSDPMTTQWLVWEGISTIQEAAQSIYNHHLQQPGSYAFELKETGKCIGNLFLRLDQENDTASFGYVVNRNFWGKGYMTEALRTIIVFCFVKLEVNRIEAEHFGVNPASGRVMEKAGMTKEGIRRQSRTVKGIVHDKVMYGIIKDDFFAHV